MCLQFYPSSVERIPIPKCFLFHRDLQPQQWSQGPGNPQKNRLILGLHPKEGFYPTPPNLDLDLELDAMIIAGLWLAGSSPRTSNQRFKSEAVKLWKKAYLRIMDPYGFPLCHVGIRLKVTKGSRFFSLTLIWHCWWIDECSFWTSLQNIGCCEEPSCSQITCSSLVANQNSLTLS